MKKEFENAISSYLSLVSNEKIDTFLDLWDEKGVWDCPAEGGHRYFLDNPSQIKCMADRIRQWFAQALSVERILTLSDSFNVAVEWNVHFRESVSRNCTIFKFSSENKILLIREFNDFMSCPKRAKNITGENWIIYS